jgi:hypothetical protein
MPCSLGPYVLRWDRKLSRRLAGLISVRRSSAALNITLAWWDCDGILRLQVIEAFYTQSGDCQVGNLLTQTFMGTSLILQIASYIRTNIGNQ